MLMIVPTFLVVHRQQILDASRVAVKAIASMHRCLYGFYACFNDCANILGCAPSAVLLIADSASRVTVMAIASHSDCTGALP